MDIESNSSCNVAVLLQPLEALFEIITSSKSTTLGLYVLPFTARLTLCFRDYQEMPELDRFEEEGIDDNAELSDLSMSERMAAEREMRKRDREEMAATGRMRPGLLYGQNSCILLSVFQTVCSA